VMAQKYDFHGGIQGGGQFSSVTDELKRYPKNPAVDLLGNHPHGPA